MVMDEHSVDEVKNIILKRKIVCMDREVCK